VLIHFPIALFIAGAAFDFLGNEEAAPAGRRSVLASATTANETYEG
jgi:uncharacterized membrane protein